MLVSGCGHPSHVPLNVLDGAMIGGGSGAKYLPAMWGDKGEVSASADFDCPPFGEDGG
jgi:hypothetical protein